MVAEQTPDGKGRVIKHETGVATALSGECGGGLQHTGQRPGHSAEVTQTVLGVTLAMTFVFFYSKSGHGPRL